MSKKKAGVIIGVVVVALASAAVLAGIILTRTDGNAADKVYVEKVSGIMGSGIGGNNRYMGVVEPQNSWDVKRDENRTVSEVFVEVGDEVAEGDDLFSYDVQEMELQAEQQELELESIDNEISDYNTQIADLQKEKAQAPADQQLDYTTRIQQLTMQIKQTEYSRKSKEAELSKTKKAIENSVVTSKISGVVKSISENGIDDSGSAAPYMTILATGDYRVKGVVNEQNRDRIMEDVPVILRSRVDESQTWTGTITKVDAESPMTGGNDYGEPEDETSTSTKYPFYIALDSADGLMLGQHVYIELDEGQQQAKEGVWLYSSYIVTDDGDPYVWAANDRNKLEKRTVELGEYDENLDMYEIQSGLSDEDLIAFPMYGLYEGVTAVTNAEEVDYESPLYQMEDTEMDGDPFMDTEMNEELYPDTEMDGDLYPDTELPDDVISDDAEVE